MLTAPVRFLGRHWDAAGAVAVGGTVFALATKDAVRDDSVAVILAFAAAGLAVLSIVLAAMSLFATFFDPHYRRVLEAAGGIKRASAPHMTVASAGAAATVVGLVTAMAWPAGGWLLQASLAGLSAGLSGWAVLGALSLVEITLFHAQARADLQRGIEDARARRAEHIERQAG